MFDYLAEQIGNMAEMFSSALLTFFNFLATQTFSVFYSILDTLIPQIELGITPSDVSNAKGAIMAFNSIVPAFELLIFTGIYFAGKLIFIVIKMVLKAIPTMF